MTQIVIALVKTVIAYRSLRSLAPYVLQNGFHIQLTMCVGLVCPKNAQAFTCTLYEPDKAGDAPFRIRSIVRLL